MCSVLRVLDLFPQTLGIGYKKIQFYQSTFDKKFKIFLCIKFIHVAESLQVTTAGGLFDVLVDVCVLHQRRRHTALIQICVSCNI